MSNAYQTRKKILSCFPIDRSSFALSDWRSQQEGSDGLADWADVLEHISEKVRQTLRTVMFAWRVSDGSCEHAYERLIGLPHILSGNPMQGIKDADSKRKLWPLLLGVLEPGTPEPARQAALDAYRGSFEQVSWCGCGAERAGTWRWEDAGWNCRV